MKESDMTPILQAEDIVGVHNYITTCSRWHIAAAVSKQCPIALPCPCQYPCLSSCRLSLNLWRGSANMAKLRREGNEPWLEDEQLRAVRQDTQNSQPVVETGWPRQKKKRQWGQQTGSWWKKLRSDALGKETGTRSWQNCRLQDMHTLENIQWQVLENLLLLKHGEKKKKCSFPKSFTFWNRWALSIQTLHSPWNAY